MATIIARAAVAACARGSKRRRVMIAPPVLLFPPLLPPNSVALPPYLQASRAASTSAPPSPHHHQHHQQQQHLLRIVDLTTMRAAAASLRAFGGGDDGGDGGESGAAAERAAVVVAAAASQTTPERCRLMALQTANDPADPPLLIPYPAASALQEALAAQLLMQGAALSPTTATTTTTTTPTTKTPPPPPPKTHTLLLLQHAPVFTVGKRGRGHGFATDAHMRAALATGAHFDADSPRGGQATFHGPGQAVAYPVVCLRSLGLGARRYVEALEDACVRAAGCWGVHAEGRQPAGRTGVWAGGRKVAAVGVRVSRGVATHGLALNVADDGGGGGGAFGGGGGGGDDDEKGGGAGALAARRSPLAWFRLIDPCGLGADGVTGLGVEEGDDGVTTSLWRELRRGGATGPSPGDGDDERGGGGGGRGRRSLGGWPTVRGAANDVAHALAAALGARAVWPGDDDASLMLPPLPLEAARAVIGGVACTAAGMAARPPRL